MNKLLVKQRAICDINHTFQDSTAKGVCSVRLAQSPLPQTSLPKASQLEDVHHYRYSKDKRMIRLQYILGQQ